MSDKMIKVFEITRHQVECTLALMDVEFIEKHGQAMIKELLDLDLAAQRLNIRHLEYEMGKRKEKE